ncbi:1-acyl-sn-glycerol-3-phosphate acyltransferase [Lachnoclostridium sp. An196]|uniref:lysophospholipid acyltransferase family protein n=1 Tax=Lachnoclostridium sp. An196 TaxID=1965583 RepID=UPI000B3AB9B3|nr:lysophospholipid acyltransferase family protein [Lachnoclostridium sp. An196]OUP21604.1 1-acyl-sn-glycerol-3-phosphate acyltransferase [Lachnoclostridium sp. An196]HIS06714.1 1-acyl-sn-glycerol-3-phosphate acyltransferase [Candidatus Choladocola avistercoris]
MIRFLLIALLLFLYLLLGIPVLLVEKLVAKINPHARDISCLRMVQWAFKLMLWITGADISYIGRENVPKDRAVLYVGNHNSYFDILLTYSQCPGLTGYVAKSEMLRYPLLRDWMKRLYCVFLDRSDLRAGMQMILTCIDYIKNGISICIFPEGTRSKDGQMQPFHEGSLKMAAKTGCPIIPMAISNSAQIFENHMPFVRPCKVIVEYGAPVYPKELSKEDQKFLGAYTQKKIQEMLDQHHID